MKRIATWILLATASCFAEDTYLLRFRMEQSNPASARSYVMLLQNKTRGSIDATRRIPYYTNPKGDAKEFHTVAIGNLIECSANGEEAGVRLDCNLESSYVTATQPVPPLPPGFPPVIKSRRVRANALAPIGREFRIARLEEPTSGNPLEIFALVERFNGGPLSPNK